MNSTGFVLAVPASMKLKFIVIPPNAAMPVNRPRISAIPTAISPYTISCANQAAQWCSSMYSMNVRYQS